MALVNPDCPKCETNRRVIATARRTMGYGFLTFRSLMAGPKSLYRCNICKNEFSGRQVQKQ